MDWYFIRKVWICHQVVWGKWHYFQGGIPAAKDDGLIGKVVKAGAPAFARKVILSENPAEAGFLFKNIEVLIDIINTGIDKINIFSYNIEYIEQEK